MGERKRWPGPGSPVTRLLALSSGLYAVGSGVFLAGNAVFFTQVVGLSPGQVGLGLSLSGVVAVIASVPAGRMADRLGVQGTWAVTAVLEALVYLAYPWVRGIGGFAAVVVVLALMECSGRAARGGYTLDVVPAQERVSTLAYIRSALNIGFAIGALLSGLALATGSREVLLGLPVLTSVVLLGNVVLIRRLPHVQRSTHDVARPGGAALRNLPFLGLSLLNGQLGVNQVLLTVVFPLWLVDKTDAPHAALAWLYGTNTVMAILLQVRMARGAQQLPGALRAARVAAVATAGSCAIAMAAKWSAGWVTVAVLLAAYVALTVGELLGSAASWGMVAELTDPSRTAEYQGVWRLGTQIQMVVGPALLTWLAISWHPEGFLVIAGWTLIVVLPMPRLVRAAQQRWPTAKPRGTVRRAADTIEQS